MPEEALHLLMDQLHYSGGDGKHAAHALAVAYDGFFRPSEVLSLCGADVHSLRGKRRRVDLPPVSVTLRPLGELAFGAEAPPRTKTGAHDDSIAFGESRGQPGGKAWVAVLLSKLAAKRPGLLFPISLGRFESLMREAVEATGLQKLKLTPHCARHGAANTEYATGGLSLKDIQKRGRWRASSSVRVYEKSTRLLRQLNTMTFAQRATASRLSTSLPNHILSQV